MSYNNFNFSVKERSKFYEPILGEKGYYSNLIVTDEDGSKEATRCPGRVDGILPFFL